MKKLCMMLIVLFASAQQVFAQDNTDYDFRAQFKSCVSCGNGECDYDKIPGYVTMNTKEQWIRFWYYSGKYMSIAFRNDPITGSCSIKPNGQFNCMKVESDEDGAAVLHLYADNNAFTYLTIKAMTKEGFKEVANTRCEPLLK